MKIKLKIINHSTYIKSAELMECFNLLSSKYRKLNTNIYIFKSNKEFICFLLKKFRLIQLLRETVSQLINKLTKSQTPAFYYVPKKEIFILQDKIMDYCNKGANDICLSDSYKIYGKYLKESDLIKAKEMWFKYIILDILIHEMTHALQHNEKRLSTRLRRIFKKWENRNEEKEAVTASIKTFEKIMINFVKYLMSEEYRLNILLIHSILNINLLYM